ncbi:DUF4430 domain-containing protein [Pseudobutyrivibrio xylanivorans]|uniref:Transcobalamin-like C-terminal domain-containing protein n=1 Tax=Pseudobutyrivibrio xylanivorans DSM 14809 TaxID=1123012 RepID=A0A1M6GBA6_PSEXY|nr:DUF4430 domain-containing protein [Pseudobutyrivibrio xylanivorans]SHJ07253.1 protein of unknown function [Pseudobutyrivibrio xylanivorans DSM 14809]
MEKKSTKKIIIGLVILAVLIGGFLLCYNKFAAKGTVGEKAIVIEVVDSNGISSEYDVNTDAEYLKDAMDELAASDSSFSFSGQEGDYGLMVEVINGEQAIYAEDNAYWALYVNGEYGQYGVTEQPVGDGDTYTWKYESAE